MEVPANQVLDQLSESTLNDPASIDVVGLLSGGHCKVFANPDPLTGFIARSTDFAYAFAVGQPQEPVVLRAVREEPDDGPGWHLLASENCADVVEVSLANWQRRGVTLHVRAQHQEVVPRTDGVSLRVAPRGWRQAGLKLTGLPKDLEDEFSRPGVGELPMAVAFVGEQAVSFCYAALVTARFWDVAVDTLPEFRRRGLAAFCFHALDARLTEDGLSPVWGALDENVASMSLARRLGFSPAAKLASLVRPEVS